MKKRNIYSDNDQVAKQLTETTTPPPHKPTAIRVAQTQRMSRNDARYKEIKGSCTLCIKGYTHKKELRSHSVSVFIRIQITLQTVIFPKNTFLVLVMVDTLENKLQEYEVFSRVFIGFDL
ncbi:hypothetical protein QVD17_39537 [Tagetes erecta]|uniref:Uncharacterized protein n=1 Tax=Tagetes erecta TaxID=13708 RepID=A0AAD8NA94_TARER|nr:hypothetical protein QVD17_39537 [Tagetes erecta]